MLTLGITGGTGCGKTALLRRIAARGGITVDCDALYYELLGTDESLRAALIGAFGAVFLPDGSLNRKALGARVFSNPEQLARLNEIVFVHICRAVQTLQAQARTQGCVLFGIDAINLFQSGLAELCNATVGVLAPENIRVSRIMTRDHIPEEYASLRIHAQEPDDFYRTRCTFLLENGEISPEEFQIKADILLDQWTKENAI